MAPEQLFRFSIITTAGVLVTIVLGTVTVVIMEGRAVIKAFENMARQPSVADTIQAMLLIVLAIIESGAIYVLLVCLVFLFANPFSGVFGL